MTMVKINKDTEVIAGGSLTVNAASEAIGIHHMTLYRHIEQGTVAWYRIDGVTFVPVTEVLRLRKLKESRATERL